MMSQRMRQTFKNPRPELLTLLEQSGPVTAANGAAGTPTAPSSRKKVRHPATRSTLDSANALKLQASRVQKNVDMEKLADGLQKLGEDDLLQVVQMVHDHKTPETYTKNDVENGEFHVDLYTLPDPLVKMLWDFTAGKTDL
jgi:transcription initiation factor IIF auxiliary subunit